MAISLKISRSDSFPVGTLVKAYPSAARQHAQPPAGPATAEATVDAAGLLTISVPNKTPLQLYASVGGEPRYLRVGDPAIDTALGTLAERMRRTRALNVGT